MKQEVKNCQSCKSKFTIEPDDFIFYQKIKVPAPTFCPECRLQRRLAIRNERTLYKRDCNLCKKSIISMYKSDSPFIVYCRDCWLSDKWDPMQYGTKYDWNISFFKQFRRLLEKVPRPNVITSSVQNSDYCNYVADGKNCYLCFGSIAVEDCLYGSPYESKNCVDVYLARESEYCYECIDCEKLFNCAYAQNCTNSFDLLFCFDCKNCQDCIGCAGLRNKKYYIFNKQYKKEDYNKEKQEIFSQGSTALLKIRFQFEELKKNIPHKFASILYCNNVTGNHIVHSKNSHHCFDIKKCQDSKYCIRMIDGRDNYDTNYCEFMELCYEYIGFWKSANAKFSNTCGECHELYYSDFCTNSSNLFGCIALKKKDYCIFNKQYNKEEYKELVVKIIQQMNDLPYKDGKGITYKYGEFFPIELSPFAYNESVAQEYFPLTKEQILKQGYSWKNTQKRAYEITIKSQDLPNHIKDVNDDILDQVISCEHSGKCNEQCTTAFKITSSELQFYKKMNLPLPRLCPNCRHYQRLKQRSPFELWDRKCQCAGEKSDNKVYQNTIEHFHKHNHCPNEFETTYAPERKEIVYCEACYQQEVV